MSSTTTDHTAPGPQSTIKATAHVHAHDKQQVRKGGFGEMKAEGSLMKSPGRRRSCDLNSFDTEAAEGLEEQSSAEDRADSIDGPRKRRRSRKDLDKKFPCTHENCFKSYSRAEHLHRHQLNHAPKQIYACNIGECDRTFVRQDLCNRHKERHMVEGSQLQRKDAMKNNVAPAVGLGGSITNGTSSPDLVRGGYGKSETDEMQHPSRRDDVPSPFSPNMPHLSSYSRLDPTTEIQNAGHNHGYLNSYGRSQTGHSTASARVDEAQSIKQRPSYAQRHMSVSTVDDKATRSFYDTKSQPQRSKRESAHGNQQGPRLPVYVPFVNDQEFAHFSLPPSNFNFDAPRANASQPMQGQYTISSPHTTIPGNYQDHREGAYAQHSSAEVIYFEQIASVPVFGDESFENQRSPLVVIANDFVNYIFNTQPNIPQGSDLQSLMNGSDGLDQYEPYLGLELGVNFPQAQRHPMAVTNLLDPSTPHMTLSREKNQSIVALIIENFNETDNALVGRQKASFLEGDRMQDSHILSRKMMQTYIESFWLHFHPQLPILHKPSFLPDKAPNLLLVAMMSIGASLLGKTHDFHVTKACAELANLLAWHLRWELFKDAHARPPAKLWVFQSLLLLEIYEKMYSSRVLHERGHLHHAFAITLMRRGSSLVGRSALDSPPNALDGRHNPYGSRQASTSGTSTPDDWWNRWITNEATHRAAWAAFVIDSIHATMFGHSTDMVTHEMRLPLPCDEALWSATTRTEVSNMEARLHANGAKRLYLMEALRRTLDGQEVRTNAFGRSILMAGLLSVRWHMNMRDLQLNSFGPSQALGQREKWRGKITRAFDFWMEDFDRSLNSFRASGSGRSHWESPKDEEIIFESRTVLHHLAHMVMHADIIECQKFAGAKRLLGRTVKPKDFRDNGNYMKVRWAPSAKARDATFYAIRFLSTVLITEKEHHNKSDYATQSPDYSARDDVLMNKSWVLYFAGLIVWCYAFALEGPCLTQSPSNDPHEQVRSMRVFLEKMREVPTPEHLKYVTGLNECASVLQVLTHTFQDTRWELLHEAAELLDNCIQLIGGRQV